MGTMWAAAVAWGQCMAAMVGLGLVAVAAAAAVTMACVGGGRTWTGTRHTRSRALSPRRGGAYPARFAGRSVGKPSSRMIVLEERYGRRRAYGEGSDVGTTQVKEGGRGVKDATRSSLHAWSAATSLPGGTLWAAPRRRHLAHDGPGPTGWCPAAVLPSHSYADAAR